MVNSAKRKPRIKLEPLKASALEYESSSGPRIQPGIMFTIEKWDEG